MLLSGYGSNCEDSCLVSCPTNWKRNGDQCYYFSKGRKNWSDAEEFCQGRGGHLAAVTNEQVNNFLKNRLKTGWIGGKRELGNETFVWTDCSSWDYNSGWRDGEPNNYGGNQACVYFTFGEWGDARCDFADKFVCSIPVCSGKCQLGVLTMTEEVESIYSSIESIYSIYTYKIHCTMYQQTNSSFQLKSFIVCSSR